MAGKRRIRHVLDTLVEGDRSLTLRPNGVLDRAQHVFGGESEPFDVDTGHEQDLERVSLHLAPYASGVFAGDPLAARPLIVPPRLRGIEPDRNRRATWLELFFDLVFVVAIAIGLNLDHDPTVGGFLQYLALFVPVWWAWAGFTYYANRFDSDDVVYRLTVLLGMFAVAALAVATNGAIDEGGAQFAAS